MLLPLLRGEAGAAGWVCALAGAALPRRVTQVAVGVVEAKTNWLSSLRCAGAHVSRAGSLSSSLSPFSHAPVYLAREGAALSALRFERASNKAPDFPGFFRIAVRALR